MGSDDIFKKRKISEKKRKEAIREERKKILIVTEGEKTEPLYFKDLIRKHRILTAQVDIDGSSKSCPKKVYEHAVKLYKESKSGGAPYDKVYCVFDRDSHSAYQYTLDTISTAQPSDTFVAIRSVPCFEYWLLLHFTYTTSPYAKTQKKSEADKVIDELKSYIPGYEKGADSLYSDLSEQLAFAKHNSKRSLKDAKQRNDENPSSHIHVLIDELEAMIED